MPMLTLGTGIREMIFFSFLFLKLFIWPCWVFVVAHANLRCVMWDLLSLCVDSLVVALGLNNCGVRV